MVFVIEFSYIHVIIFVYRREVLIVQSNNTYLLFWIPKFNYWLLNTSLITVGYVLLLLITTEATRA